MCTFLTIWSGEIPSKTVYTQPDDSVAAVESDDDFVEPLPPSQRYYNYWFHSLSISLHFNVIHLNSVFYSSCFDY